MGKMIIPGMMMMMMMLTLGAGMIAAPSSAEAPSPLAQHSSGMPMQEIQCNDSRTLMEAPRGTPARVYGNSVETMQQRGWAVVQTLQGKQATPATEIEISTKKAITTCSMKDVSPKTGELGPFAYFFPQYCLTFPEQILLGEKFEVVLDYTFVIPSHVSDDFTEKNPPCYWFDPCKGVLSDDGDVIMHFSYNDLLRLAQMSLDADGNNAKFLNYEEPAMICGENCLNRLMRLGSSFQVTKNAYVELLDEPDYVFVKHWNATKYLPIRTFDHGTIQPSFDNTQPQQKTLTFVINESDTYYPLGKVRIDFGGDGKGQIHFYVGQDGVVRLSDEPITIADKVIPPLALSVPEPSVETPPEDPLEGMDADDIEWLADGLGAWYREYTPDEGVEAELRNAKFPEWFIEKFFALHPELRAQSFAPPPWSAFLSAHAQTPPSFVHGNAHHYAG